MGRLRLYPGRADGRRGRHANSRTPARADGGRLDRRAHPRVRGRPGVDLNWADTDRVTRLHQYNVFPNMTFLANADHLTLMCSRPGPDPDRGELVMFLMTRMTPGAARNKPTDVRMPADQSEPGMVLTQDIRVLAGL